MTTSDKLRAIRRHLSIEGHRVTQREMAEWLGTSQQSYGQWELGKRKLSKRDNLLVALMWAAMEKGLLKKFYWGKDENI